MKNFRIARILLPLSLLTILLMAIACGPQRKTGYEMMLEMKDLDEELEDSAITKIYITDTKPIDSVDQNKLIYDIWRIEIDEFPDTLKVYARVYDSLGNFVTNMANPYKKEGDTNIYFTSVTETLGEHVPRRKEPIDPFWVREYGANDSIPYSIVMTVDYSGSMNAVMDAIYEGTELFVRMKTPYDRIALSSFNKYTDMKVPLSKSKRKIISIYRSKRTQGYGLFTGAYDALDSCMDVLQDTPKEDPRILVILSDFDDNYSQKKIMEIVDRAKELKVHIFTIGFGYSKDEHAKFIAGQTGGRFYKAYSKKELIAIFRDIYMSLRYYYFVTYKPPKFFGYHHVLATLELPKRSDTLFAEGEYGTGDLFPYDSLDKIFSYHILFEFDSAVVRPESYYILDGIADAMLSQPRIRLQIEGHTDNIGPLENKIEYNQKLSEDRAEAVMRGLIGRGVEPYRLRSRGFGMSQPVASNETEEGRTKNRRTEFRIIAK